jgi:hypothetical protein
MTNVSITLECRIKSFDDLLEIIKDSLEADQNVPDGRPLFYFIN